MALAWLLLPLELSPPCRLAHFPRPACLEASQEYGQAAEIIRQIVTLDGLDLAVLKVSRFWEVRMPRRGGSPSTSPWECWAGLPGLRGLAQLMAGGGGERARGRGRERVRAGRG